MNKSENLTTFDIEEGTLEVVVTHDFAAARERVFQIYTDPTLRPQWWGPSRLVTVVDVMDVRPGGSWRIVQRDTNGDEYNFHGVYHCVLAPDYLVSTFEYEGVPGHVLLETARFVKHNGGTRLIIQSVFQSVTDRDAMVDSGMCDGMSESMSRLEKLAGTLDK